MNPDTGQIVAMPTLEEERERLREQGFVELPADLQSHAQALLSSGTTKRLREKRKRERQNRKQGRRNK